MSKVCRFAIGLFVLLWVSASLRLEISGQVRPVYDRGAVGLMQMLKRLNTTASVLMIGAHPDDEDTALLAYLARGENARTAYLSLTRGDGGQNIIGSELGEALGVIRTEELLQARRLDGAEQYFTRAYDFGFSKTLDEAKQKWDEKIILCDAVRVIRNFRPLVVVSQFSGTPVDGHGQHQFAGYISPLAVKAAADTSQCRDSGAPWQVKKFYVRQGFRATGEPTLRINTGKYDPLLGRSYFEIAMEARSQHKSQEQGVLELRGDQLSNLNLIGSTTKEKNIFDGIDVSLNGMTNIDGPDEPRIPFLANIQKSVEAAIAEFDFRKPEKIVPHLVSGYSLAKKGESDSNSTAAKIFLADKQKQFKDAIAVASELRIDALADSETIIAGEPLLVGVKAYAPDDSIKVKDVTLKVPYRWSVNAVEAPKANSPANILREVTPHARYFNVTTVQTPWYTQPYWLRWPREGEIFQWKDMNNDDETLPFQRRPLVAQITVEVLGRDIVFERDVEYRFADDIRGEIRRNVDFVPAVNVEMDQPFVLVNASDKLQTKRVTMTVTNLSNGVIAGKPSLFLGSDKLGGRVVTPAFELKRKGEKTSVSWDITIAAKTPPGRYSIEGEVYIGNTNFNHRMRTVEYPHIQTHRYYKPNRLDFQVIDLKTSPAKIGYVTGSGDRVQNAIRQMGFAVETITESELASGNLSRFDTIVVGIRAYQVRPDVVANNQRLLDYVRNGGTLIVQYQLPAYAPLAPFTTQMGPRVADENAAVNILDPKHPIFNFPNKITAADFAGWVQERNLYNFTNFGAEYTGLLESHDAGEAENKGGLVIAKLGKGNYVYCSYSMFRQLPAGVPGAYRLFANLVSLPKATKK